MVNWSRSGIIRNLISPQSNRIFKEECMEISIDKSQLLGRITEMMDKQHVKIDAANNVDKGIKDKGNGFLEALYQVENLVLNWGMETRDNI